MQDGHDPNKTLRQAPIEFTGDSQAVGVDNKEKKIYMYTAGAAVVTLLGLLIPAISIILVLSMPAFVGLLVYAGILRYKAVVAAENKAPDWSKIQVPRADTTKEDPKAESTDKVTYN